MKCNYRDGSRIQVKGECAILQNVHSNYRDRTNKVIMANTVVQ